MTEGRGVFLDRDGVIVDAVERDGEYVSPRTIGEFTITAGAAAQVARLHQAGWLVVVVTNQPDLARGQLRSADLEHMHALLTRETGVDAILVCPHGGHEDCRCRKPRPGMLLDGAAAHGIDLARAWMVGDRWVDIAAADAAGIRSVLIDRPYSWSDTSAGAPPANLSPTARVEALPLGVDIILSNS